VPGIATSLSCAQPFTPIEAIAEMPQTGIVVRF
jgi:hypothetical protein